MLLVFDIGNSNIVLGTYEGKKLLRHWRISTDRQKTGDEYGMLMNNLFHYQGIRMTDIDAFGRAAADGADDQDVRAVFPYPPACRGTWHQDGNPSEI